MCLNSLHFREKTPDDRSTPVPNNCSEWLDSDDGEDSDVKENEPSDNLDHLTLAERLARKRKIDSTSDVGKFVLQEGIVSFAPFVLIFVRDFSLKFMNY